MDYKIIIPEKVITTPEQELVLDFLEVFESSVRVHFLKKDDSTPISKEMEMDTSEFIKSVLENLTNKVDKPEEEIQMVAVEPMDIKPKEQLDITK